MKKVLVLSLPVLLFASQIFASDTGDAEMLRSRCEKESKSLEICTVNFGDVTDQANFQEAMKKIKMGKLKITQSKFKEAIEIYNAYLKQQNEIYTSLASKYLERTQKLNDEVSEELVDFIDNPKADSYFKLAYRNLEDGKTAMTRKYPVQVIDACRRAKQYALSVYGVAGKPVPEKYKIDQLDIELKTGK